MRSIDEYTSYVFILAHPDDEIYTANIIKSLVDKDKKVNLIYITSGDYYGAQIGRLRKKELASAMKLLGIKSSNAHLLNVSEKKLGNTLGNVHEALHHVVQSLNPDCIISHDFEGGHSIHDFVSYLAYKEARNATDLWVFPAYHKQPKERVWNQFITGKKVDFSLKLADKQVALKYKIMATHVSQKQFFDTIISSKSKNNFLHREVLRLVNQSIDYKAKPCNPIGYEFTGSPTAFSDFVRTIKKFEDKEKN